MVKKVVSFVLSLAVAANLVQPIYAVDFIAIPQNVRPPIFTPAPVQTRSTELSFESIETTIGNAFKPSKEKAKLQATYSGTCGTNVNWNLDTSTGKMTISGTGAMTDYETFPEVPWDSFRGDIRSVTIGKGVTSIGGNAFDGCLNLNSVTIPDSVTHISWQAFEQCENLYSITIPNSVISIDLQAFWNCIRLTSINIPASVTYIGDKVFDSCSSLTSVTYKGTRDPGASSADVFYNTPVTSVKVPWNYKDSTFCGISISKPPAPTKSPSRSPMATRSRSPMATRSRSPSKSPMATRSRSPMATRSRSPMATRSRSPMATPTPTPTTKFTMPVNYFHKKSDAVFVYPMLYYALALE